MNSSTVADDHASGTPRPWRPAHPALVAGILFWIALAILFGLALAREREQAIRHAQEQQAMLAAVVEEDTARTFDSVNVALAGVASYLSTQDFPTNDPSVRELMRARLKYLPPVRALFMIGPDGWIRHDTDFPTTPHVSLADREYFRQYLLDPKLDHALSPALQSRSGTGWFIASTRRVTGPSGEFRGVVVAAVQLDWLSRLYQRLQLQPGQTLALLQADGRMVARFPQDNALVGRSYAQLPVFAEHLPQRRSGVFVTDGPPLGYPRLVSYGALDTQPLVVALTIPMSAVLATWYRTAAGALGAMVVLTLLTAAGGLFFVQKESARRRALAHRLARVEALAAAEANAKFRTFFEQGCFFSCVLSVEGTVLEANQGGLDACGVDRDLVLGRKFWDCPWWSAPEGSAAAVREAVAAAANGTTVHIEAAFRMADGQQSLVELAFSPIRNAQGTPLSVAALGMDITQRKHQEERLRTLADELANADRLKREFLATLSHELRNVLAPQVNALNILERVDGGSAHALKARDLLKAQVAQMRRLVDDLLDVSRVESGKVRLEQEYVDLRQLLAVAADAAQAFMSKPRHELTTSWPDAPLPVYVDRARIQQVFANLLGNAAKYTPPGGHIRLNARREGQEIVAEVVDDGMGIPVEAQSRVFDMFEQVGHHLSHSQGGLGIGLSLVQKLVALHGGHVEAFSEGPDLGSTFTVSLPVAEPPAATASRAADLPHADPTPDAA